MNPTWSRAKQQRLLAEVQGFWGEDTWDMHHSPVGAGLTPTPRQRYLYFECKSQSINGELKYACWKKFSDGRWRTTQESTKVHRLIKWLNTLNPPPRSLVSRGFEAWRDKYRKYLKRRGMYNPGTTTRMDREQRPCVTPRDSAYRLVEPSATVGSSQPFSVQYHSQFPPDPATLAAEGRQGLSSVLLGDLCGGYMSDAIAITDALLRVPRAGAAKDHRQSHHAQAIGWNI